jgi:hypothetical protein
MVTGTCRDLNQFFLFRKQLCKLGDGAENLYRRFEGRAPEQISSKGTAIAVKCLTAGGDALCNMH